MTLTAKQAGIRGLPRPVKDPNVQQNLQYLAQQIQITRDDVGSNVIGVPYFQYLKESVGGATATADIFLRVVEPGGRKGTLSAWVNRAGYGDADPDGAADATIRLFGTTLLGPSDAWDLAGGGTVTLFNDLKVDAGKGKRIFFELVLDDGVTTGKRDFRLGPTTSPITSTGGIVAGAVDAQALADAAVTRAKILDGAVNDLKLADQAVTAAKVAVGAINTAAIADAAVQAAKIADAAVTQVKIALGAIDTARLADAAVVGAKIADAALTTAKFASGIEPVGISTAGTLPTTKTTNTLYWSGGLYRWSGTAYVKSVATTDLSGTISTTQLADGSVTTAKLGNSSVTVTQLADGAVTQVKMGSGLRVPEIVGALPAAGTQGRLVLLTTDNKLYRDTGAAWTAAVPTSDLSGQIAGTQITDGAISTAKLAANSVTAAKIAAGTITSNEIASDTIVAGNIAAGAIGASEIAAGAVIAGKIAAGVVSTNELAAGAVTTAKLAADAVTAGIIAAGAVSTSELAAGAVTAVKIAAGTITTNEIAAGTITGGNIAGLTITGANIAGTTITGAKLVAGTITATQIAAGTITTNEIASNTITAGNIAASTITGAKIAALTITAGNLAADSVDASKIVAASITGDRIAGLTITGDKISANAITSDKISVATLSAIAANVGTLTAGRLTSATNEAGIQLSGAPDVSWKSYVNMNSAEGWFIYAKDAGGVERLKIGHDGSAFFGGEVRSSSFTSTSPSFSFGLSVLGGLSVGGAISSDSSGTFHGGVQVRDYTSLELLSDVAGGLSGWQENVSSDGNFNRRFIRSGSTRFYLSGSASDFNAYAASGSWVNSSDERLKTDVAPISDPVQRLRALPAVRYQRRLTGRYEMGWLAQSVRQIVPEAVLDVGTVDGLPDVLALNPAAMTAVLWEAVREMEGRMQAAGI